jgi:8-amino-7-oxononanoate synthase
MHFGCLAAGARQIRYRHADAHHLGQLLSQYQSDKRPKFILTESVFSMDGDVAPIAEIAVLAREHDAMLFVDDAHGTGILGPHGAGLSAGADFAIGTFSKALGGFGGYVACSETVRDYLVNRCSGLIYSTALPPPVLGAMDAALDLLPAMDHERARVASLASRFRDGANELGLDTGDSSTQIVPVILGTPEAALAMSGELRRGGFWGAAIRPPTVPNGTARLRLAFTAAHEESDADRLLEIFEAQDAPRRATAH